MQRNHLKREGVAVTECALVAPIIIAFMLFTIEICTVLFLRETVTIAAYEGARVGIQRGNTDEMVAFRVPLELSESEIRSLTDSSWDQYRLLPEENLDPESAARCEDTALGTAPPMECTCRRPDGTEFKRDARCH